MANNDSQRVSVTGRDCGVVWYNGITKGGGVLGPCLGIWTSKLVRHFARGKEAGDEKENTRANRKQVVRLFVHRTAHTHRLRCTYYLAYIPMLRSRYMTIEVDPAVYVGR